LVESWEDRAGVFKSFGGNGVPFGESKNIYKQPAMAPGFVLARVSWDFSAVNY
jgi:hypothetical protein